LGLIQVGQDTLARARAGRIGVPQSPQA